MKLKRGQYVRHRKFGWGTVLDLQTRHTTVFFNRTGVRKLSNSEAVFQSVEDQASIKRRFD